MSWEKYSKKQTLFLRIQKYKELIQGNRINPYFYGITKNVLLWLQLYDLFRRTINAYK